MSFKEIDNQIDYFYVSAVDDIVNDFYNVVLSQTVRYDRLSGFFKSDSLAVAARGITKLIENGGHMRLLCGAQLSKEDIIAIEHADDLKDIVNKNFLDEYENLENELVKNHVLLLGWMIANDFLEIKIGINTNGSEYYPDGMLHSKRGILYDENDDCILFMGSVNETRYGWTVNVEDLVVNKSWNNYEVMKKPINNFEDLWEGNIDSLLVFNIPDESKRILTDNAPKNEKQLKKLIDEIEKIKSKPKDDRKLFPHQKTAIKSWLDNDKKGILEMATGTGKTFTALKCLEEVSKHEDLLVVIACPFSHIINQWEQDIVNLDLGYVYNFYSDMNSHWRKQSHELQSDINLKIKFKKPNIILTTHNTFSKNDFINFVNGCNIKSLLIVDEMHHVGAKGFSQGLDANYDYKLGLSATPSRYMDYEGTERLINSFDKIVFKFTIEDALNKINPATHKSFLTPYEYHPIKVGLNASELEKYKKYNKQIAQLYHGDTDDIKDDLKGLFNKRRKVINNAEQKYEEFRNILKTINNKNHLIVFCSDMQIEKVLKILGEENFSPKHKFTQDEGTKPKKEFGGLSQRQFLLNEFDSGLCKALVAIKCLDEGVDVPSANKVIIMSSTTNPAEYIQRRGRVLRRCDGKDFAHIYDLCVIPDNEGGISDKIIDNERKRLVEFTKTAHGSNKLYCINLFKKWGIL